jgi:hypothetical protein
MKFGGAPAHRQLVERHTFASLAGNGTHGVRLCSSGNGERIDEASESVRVEEGYASRLTPLDCLRVAMQSECARRRSRRLVKESASGGHTVDLHSDVAGKG